MAKHCQITGRKIQVGNHVSHSHHKEKRKFKPNLFKRRFYLAEENRWISLTVSAKGIRYINKKGLLSALQEAKSKGYITKY